MDNGRGGTARPWGRHPAAHSLPAQARSPRISRLRGGLSISFTESRRVGPKVACESHHQSTGCLVRRSICVLCLCCCISGPLTQCLRGEGGEQPL